MIHADNQETNGVRLEKGSHILTLLRASQLPPSLFELRWTRRTHLGQTVHFNIWISGMSGQPAIFGIFVGWRAWFIPTFSAFIKILFCAACGEESESSEKKMIHKSDYLHCNQTIQTGMNILPRRAPSRRPRIRRAMADAAEGHGASMAAGIGRSPGSHPVFGRIPAVATLVLFLPYRF